MYADKYIFFTIISWVCGPLRIKFQTYRTNSNRTNFSIDFVLPINP